MEFKKILVTPALANEYLQANVKNRRVKEPVVLRYAQEMKKGNWKEDTAEVIKISKSGIVLDGQHRLLAVVKSNIPIYFHIAFDVEDAVFDVLDTGSPRNASDIFKIQGIKNDSTAPSTIAFWHALFNDGLVHGMQKNRRLTNAEILIEYNKRPNTWQTIMTRANVWYHAFSKVLSPSFIGGFYAVIKEMRPDVSDSFMSQLCSGMDIENNAIALLRQKLISDKISMRKMSPNIKLALVIKTWNYFIQGNTKVKILKYCPENDEYPKLVS